MMNTDGKQKKIGVFVCHCGVNIAGVVDVEQVAREMASYPCVTFSTNYIFMCSEPGQQTILDTIKEQDLDSVIIAACSPKLHEKTFQNAAKLAGLNPYMVEIANIREQCSWVHSDKEQATRKALEIIKSVVEKLRLNQALTPIKCPVDKKVLIIGGGISGIQASLDIANRGHPVVLVERDASIGGHMAELSGTSLTFERSSELLSLKLMEVFHHPNIKLLQYSEVVDLNGYIGNFNVIINKKATLVDWEKCHGCGICLEKCPVSVPSQFEHPVGKKRAIYLPPFQTVSRKAVIDKEICQYFENGCVECQKICPKNAILFDQRDRIIEEEIGAVVVATGYKMYPKEYIGEYGGGKYKNVLNGLEFERILANWDPDKGPIRRPSDGKEVKEIVFVQCSGSRDPERGMPYCSKVCCTVTAKQAMLFKQIVPDGEAYVFYIDIRTGGKGLEEFTQNGIADNELLYIRGKVSKIFQEDDKMIVWGVDTLMGMRVDISCDLVVLATAMVPSSGAKDLAKRLKISSDEHGFFSEVHPKLRPVESPTAGIYLAGCAKGPMDISESIACASGAASKIMALFSQDTISHEPIVAYVDEDLCAGCGICVEACPYSARNLHERKKIAGVIEVLCQGCGACIAACPNGASQQRNFAADQLLHMIEAVF
jgi:heterodisulfide reductase subunit A